MIPYHTAGDKVDTPAAYPPRARASLPDGSLAFVWDLEGEQRLPAAYDRCDVLYAEPPSRHGYELFRGRRDVGPGRGWKVLMAGIANVIEERGDRAVLILGGREQLRVLPEPTQLLTRVRLVPPSKPNDDLLVALVYGKIPAVDHTAIVHSLASTYSCIGDFTCGFGNAGRIFIAAGKHFVMSDVNPRCIGAIAQHAPQWPRP